MGDKDKDDKKTLTAEDVRDIVRDALKEVIPDAVNAAVNTTVTARLKRELEGDAFKGTIAEAVKAAVAEASPKGSGEGDKDGGDSKLADQVSELKKGWEEERAARQKAEEAQKAQARRSALIEQLSEGGVVKEMLAPALALLLTEQKRIEHNEAGEVVWRGDDKLKPHEPLAAGVKGWLDSDLGKRFLPPREAAGSGSRGAVGTTGEDGKKVYTDGDLGSLMSSI